MALPLSSPIVTMSQAVQNTGSPFNVSAAVDDLKSRFMHEWSRDPTKEEIIRWNILKESLTCWNCSQVTLKCTTNGPDSLPCTRCTTLNTQQICTRVIEERRTRVKRIMNLDEDTFVALQAACFQPARSPPQPHTLNTGRNVWDGAPRLANVSSTVASSIPVHGHRQRSSSPSSTDLSRHTTPTPNLPSSRIPASSSTPRAANTPMAIDLTDNLDRTVFTSNTRPQSPRQQYTPPGRINRNSAGHSSTSATHSRYSSYPPGSAFSVFASDHSPPPPFRQRANTGGNSSFPPTGRRPSVESQFPTASSLYTLPPPPASAPAAPMLSSFPPISRGPPPATASPSLKSSLHSPFTSPEDPSPRRQREPPTSIVLRESEKIRQVTAMLAQHNSEIRAVGERYQSTEGVANSANNGRWEREDEQKHMIDGRSARDLVARLEDELDRSRNLNRRLIQHNEELRNTQRDMDALRLAYRDLLQKNEVLQRQQRTATPVRMMRHMKLSSPGREGDVHEMDTSHKDEDCAIDIVRRDLEDALRELSVAKEALNDSTAAKYDRFSQGEGGGSSAPKKRVDQDIQTRQVIAEHTNIQLLIRSLHKVRNDLSNDRISKTDMVNIIDRIEKQLSQMAQRMLESLPNEYEGIMEALVPERGGSGNLLHMSGTVEGPGGSGGARLPPLHGPINTSDGLGPMSPSSGGSGSLSPETRLKRRRVEDVAGDESE